MTPLTSSYLTLSAAIVCEIIATSLLQQSQQFTRLVPSVLTALFYAGAFYFLSLSLRTLPVGVAYAIWSGVGIVLISLIGWLLFQQKLDLPALIGIGFIVVGVLIVNLFSKTVGH
ncbi:DMT family transporter [Alcaligenes sp. SDU_A2]|uniref:DMT family transporter n=1 Tax=Alcaligenes sp. SDU_A2 TaxID=3136634 RepID=UPI002BAD4063|nr:SMR family transporter [Alcaligenes sp.]HRL28511.1 SMR family transporter [Alcaligenes sp.]